MSNNTTIFPQELLDICIGNKVWVFLKGNQEVVGILRGFDNYYSMVLDEVKE